MDFLASLSGDDWPEGIPATVDFEDGRGPFDVRITGPGASLAIAGWTDDALRLTVREPAVLLAQHLAETP